MSNRRPLSREACEATIEGFTHGGEGVARIEGKAVFVPGTIPGERVRLRVIDDRKRWARAQLGEVLEPSADRVTPPCPYVPECGGCDLQHIAPAAQRRLKRRVVLEQLERVGHLADPPVAECRAVGPDTGYRNHARMHADPVGRLGFHRAASQEVVTIDRCLILTPATQAVRDALGDETGAREVEVRGHDATGTSAAVLHGAAKEVRGDEVLTERVAGFELRFDASCFFQVNTAGAEAIVEAMLAAVGQPDGARVWDLYAGVGLLSLPLARAGAEVVAVEGQPRSAEWLRANAGAAGLELTVKTSDVMGFVSVEQERPEAVVLDPPRTGAGKRVVTALAAQRPARIVYVACDPAALARDAQTLADHGYRLELAQPLDLFPMTHHVEVVATFTPVERRSG